MRVKREKKKEKEATAVRKKEKKRREKALRFKIRVLGVFFVISESSDFVFSV